MSDENSSQPKADIGRQQIGGIYAKAFLAAAQKDGAARELLDELGSLVLHTLDKQPAFEATLASPRIAAEEKVEILNRVFQQRVSAGLLTFLKVVCRHDRLDCLREIHAAAKQQYNESRGIVEVHLTTAQPLDGKLTRQIEQALSQHLKQEVELQRSTDTLLIGGMIIRIGDMVYDSSLRQRLFSLRQQTVDKTVQQMRSASDRFADE
jgi:F-type H+-transporting ATPase subunit delta